MKWSMPRGAWRNALLLTVALGCVAVRAEMLEALKVPEGFVVERVAGPPLSSYPMFMALDERGRMYIAESSGLDLSGKEMVEAPGCVILRLEDSDDDGVYDEKVVFADQLSLPMGVLWHDGALYVASPPDFVRLEDRDGDGVAEQRKVLVTGWNIFNTASLHGPFLGPDGYLYLTHGRHGYDITTKEGVHLKGPASHIWRCRPDGSALERFCGGGFDNPVELVFTEGGEMLGTMTYFTDPKNGQRDALMHWVEGGVYPKPHESNADLIRTGELMPTMTKFSRIAPSGLARLSGVGFGADAAGDLVSAQFNPSRVQRHKLLREGATFRTEDSDFLTSSDANFHPTDVLEDMDGSLLVSDTGAWYVDACPISRVARPEIRGGIYRVRRADQPWRTGQRDAMRVLPEAPVDALVEALADPRPLVHETAREMLVKRGPKAADALAAILNADAGDARQLSGAVWAYGRIAPVQDAAPLFAALRSNAPEVRLAAARMLGLRTDAGAGAALIAALGDADLAVRREAATSLGRLQADAATPPLLAAAAQNEDRFLEHALIFALIRLNDPAALAHALEDGEPFARKAALIALDQLGSPALVARHAVALLDAPQPALRQAALWVASHHTNWSREVLSFVEQKISADAATPEADAALKQILLAYSAEADAQALVGRLATEALPEARRALLLEVMSETRVETLPAVWLDALTALLESGDAARQWAALRVIRTRGLEGFDPRLKALAGADDVETELRLAALATQLARHPALDDAQFDLVVAQLDTARPPAVRQPASEIIAKAKLSRKQQLQLAENALPKADALTFVPLLDALAQGGDPQVGATLVAALGARAEGAPGLSLDRLDTLLAGFPDAVRAAAAPLRAQAEAAEASRLARLTALAPKLGTGDVGRGRRLFFSERAACYTCHAIGEEGGHLGPDLTTIGIVRSGLDLLEAVVFPSASQVPGYENFRFEVKDAEFGGTQIVEGVLGGDEAAGILIKTGVDATLRVPRADLVSMTPHTLSKMPENLDATLAEGELLDLIAFLQSLNNESWLLPEQRDAPQGDGH